MKLSALWPCLNIDISSIGERVFNFFHQNPIFSPMLYDVLLQHSIP